MERHINARMLFVGDLSAPFQAEVNICFAQQSRCDPAFFQLFAQLARQPERNVFFHQLARQRLRLCHYPPWLGSIMTKNSGARRWPSAARCALLGRFGAGSNGWGLAAA